MEKWRVGAGLALSSVWIVLVGWYVWARWSHFTTMDPNAMGDFLAGAAGPLALFWLVLGYFQQGEELRLNTEALHAQSEELAASVDAQNELVAATKASHDFQREQASLAQHQRFLLAQPRFMARTKDWNQTQIPLFGRVEITNLGGLCTLLQVVRHDPRLKVGLDVIDRFEYNETLDIKLTLPSENFCDRYVVTMAYQDNDGDWQQQFFHLSVDDQTRITGIFDIRVTDPKLEDMEASSRHQ